MKKELVTNINTFAESIGVPVLVFDNSLRLKHFNQSARNFIPNLETNTSAEKIFSKKRISNQILQCIKTGKIEFEKMRYRTNKGPEVAVNIRDLEIDNTKLAIVTLSDLSPLSEAKMMRTDFVSNVSHEMRSPLTSIRGFVETLKGPAGDDLDKREKFLDVIGKEADRMTNLVSDLLSLSLVEAKEKRKIKGFVDLGQIITAAFEATELRARNQGKILKMKIEKELPEIPGNQDNLFRVMVNLIENAISYSGENTIIKISAKSIQKEEVFLRPALKITVSDKGDGISQEEIPRLTERFYRIDRSRSRDMGGTGLGLAIVKHILVRHKGKLSIDSIKGKGSNFNIYLPIT